MKSHDCGCGQASDCIHDLCRPPHPRCMVRTKARGLLHELAHVRRWDNRSSSFERERACDEIAVQSGAAPETYVSGILKVCRFQLAEAIAGAAGIKGPGFKRRMELIMSYPIRNSLPHAPRALLGALAAVMTVAPFIVGFLQQSALRAQTGGGGQKSQSAAKPGLCSFAGVAYLEGTVLKMGTSAYAATKICAKEAWEPTDKTATVVAKAPPPFVCEPKPSTSANECVCSERGRFSLGGHREHGKRQDAVRQARVRAVHHVAARDPG